MADYDDDDYMSDELPDFADEAEFDDYLNDEEYDLMNEVLPQAKKELSEYQGWDNLSVKLAIFENEFDLQAALTELKRKFKKKKPKKEVTPATTTTKKVTKDLGKLSLNQNKKQDDEWLDLDEPRKTEEEDDTKIVYKKVLYQLNQENQLILKVISRRVNHMSVLLC